jgi:hypothetical protein
MVRDRFLTEEAYRRGYNTIDMVERNREMWSDALLARYQISDYLRTTAIDNVDSLSTITLIEEHLNPYVNELQNKYNDLIEINVEEFNKIELTRTDMIVIQTNVPFPNMVPGFPQVTTDPWLDYGKKME